MAFNKFFLLYFSIVFNIFSDDRVKFIVKIQDVVDDSQNIYNNGKNLKDLFYKEISIEKNKLNQDKYKSEELIELLGINNDQELKKYNISNLNYFVKFFNGRFLYFKGDIIKSKYFSSDAEKVICFRPKAKYNFDIIDRYIMKDNFVLEKCETKITKENYIKRCNRIKEVLNSDNCCFLLNEELYIWLSNKLIEEVYFIFNDYFRIKDSKVFYPLDITIVDINNRKYKQEDYFVTKNLYFFIKDFMSKIAEKPSAKKMKYEDFKYIKDNGKIIFNFEEKLKNNNYSQIDEKLKGIKLNINSKIEVFIKCKYVEDIEDKKDKKLSCYHKKNVKV